MISRFTKKAIQDLVNNRLLNSVTIITIALSVLIVSSFTLFFSNANNLLNSWKKGVRAFVYLKPQANEAQRLDIKYKIQQLQGVDEARFISKKDALQRMKSQLKNQSSLLDNLKSNPLPDAFEIRMLPPSQQMVDIEKLAQRIRSLAYVDEVEYGQRWMSRFTHIINMFKFVGYGMGGLFVLATLFIIANTIRLVLYSRQEEIEVMRLVGATDGFIKTPFYIEGTILGASGGIIGLTALFCAYRFIEARFHQGLTAENIEIAFLSLGMMSAVIIGSMLIGWVGCFLSLKQFLKA